MKRILTTFAAALLIALTGAAQDLLAFPGAEGFGRYTKGARGVANPQVYHVTTLKDSGTGSLRDALSKEGRIIVFDVSGVINLTDALIFKSNTTVLGQTAPGEGIQLYGNRVSFSNANNLIIRHLRIRMGVNGPSGKDAAGSATGTNQIFDHLSVLWGRDENFSISSNDKQSGPKNITIQNSIIGQGLQSHSCGGLIQTDNGVTLYRNLYIENKTRNPKVKGLNQYVNNVVYNWGEGGCYIMSGSEGDSWADIENNYFMKGPWVGAKNPFTRGTPTFRYYGAGNYYDDNKDGVINGHLMTVEEMKGESGDGIEPYSTFYPSLAELNAYVAANFQDIQAIPEINNKMTALEALKWVVDSVGPSLPARDEVDQYLIDELLTYGTGGTKAGISSEKQLPHQGTGVLSGGVKPLDSDNDGIPDEWESAHGLNPNDATDAVAIAANGYTNIENYVNTIDCAYPYIKKPIKLTLNNAAKTSMAISWDLNKNTKYGFEIELSSDNGVNYTVAATVPANNTSHSLTGLTPETTYKVRMRSLDGNGLYSDYSDVIDAETTSDPSAPHACVNPTPADGGFAPVAGGVTLKWENVTKDYFGTVKYTVYLGANKDNLPAVAENLTVKEYTLENMEAGQLLYWRVDATNDLGTTPGPVWSFTTQEGGTLFYTDFHTQPQEWAEKWGDITANTNIYNTKNSSYSVAGMTFGSGENTHRIIAMPGCFSADGSKDYGPATAADAGATERCVQFYTTASGGYMTMPVVQGPCTITMWVGNPEAKAKTAKLKTIVNGQESDFQNLALGAKKRIFKFSYTYTGANPVQFKFDSNAVKCDINDILIEAADNSAIKTVEMPEDNASVTVFSGDIYVSGVSADSVVTVYDLAGRMVASAKGESIFSLARGLYIVNINGVKSVKVML